jgi:hypothetical protein
LRALMRVFSYLFHGLLALFLLAISAVALASGTALHLEMLPWSGQTGTVVLLGAGLFGLLALFLALKGSVRFLFFLWSLAVFAMLVKGFFLSPYHFEGPGGLKSAGLLTCGALLAIVGAWFQMASPTVRR